VGNEGKNRALGGRHQRGIDLVGMTSGEKTARLGLSDWGLFSEKGGTHGKCQERLRDQVYGPPI